MKMELKKHEFFGEWTVKRIKRDLKKWMDILKSDANDDIVREKLLNKIQEFQLEAYEMHPGATNFVNDIIARDCARMLRGIFRKDNERKAKFSVFKTLRKIACGEENVEVSSSFSADIIHIFRGLERKTGLYLDSLELSDVEGREASTLRSDRLDKLWDGIETIIDRIPSGLNKDIIKQQQKNKKKILKLFRGTENDWQSYSWHLKNVIKSTEVLGEIINISDEERESINLCVEHHIPFGITPYYASLIDVESPGYINLALRAQVIPGRRYVDEIIKHREDKEYAFDFMLEHSTSPEDLITRRYPSIVILKPYNTCPQICVYCQRNWQIKEAMASDALAGKDTISNAIKWINEHKSIREVLVTGGDPLTMPDSRIESILQSLAKIDHVERIRIGTRIPVTLPMRITDNLSEILGSFRIPGRREICLITHVEHPLEITPDVLKATEKIKKQGISIYNQHVYTFYVSRRFEAANLRKVIRLAGIDPYYTFLPKGKEETMDYRVPIARLMQELKEELRLFPGLVRTDEPVYNVPGLGKNYLRAVQHRDLISILPDGSRIYEFHPWEKKITPQGTYIGRDVPILDYLRRLNDIGENPADYESIWYYF